MTARAVRTFQRRAGLRVDGVAGRATRRALGRLGAPALRPPPVLRRGMVGWDVAVLQFLLTRRGAPTGIVDGYFGGETKRALRRFQRRAGLCRRTRWPGPDHAARARRRRRGRRQVRAEAARPT